MIKHSMALALTLAAVTLSSPATAATVVNLDGKANASLNGSNAVVLNLSAGVYKLSFVNNTFTAFNRFGTSSGCNGLGKSCIRGFENSARFIINGSTFLFGDGAASGGLGPQSTGGYYSTAAQSFAASSVFSTSFTLAAPGAVSFFLFDDNLGDNTGGVSLSVAAVPEPTTWMLMLLGFGAIGFSMRSRAKTQVRFQFA